MTTKLIAAGADLANAGGQNDQDNPGGWLQEIGLLYRLTDDRSPCNRDEISVTMANGSRSPEACTRRAAELLELLRKSATESIAADACLASAAGQAGHLFPSLIDRLVGLRDSVSSFEDSGPAGSGWKSGVLIDQIAALDEAIRTLRSQRAETEALRMGYNAARLEVESLKAQLHAAKKINAAQFGLLAASIPGSALRASHGRAPAVAAAPLPSTAYAALPEYGINTASHAHFRVLGFTANQMCAFADATCALRASHGQAQGNDK